MAKIKVKALKVGMTLNADVCDPNGRFLLGTGCELSEKHLKALNAWGVISVDICDADMPDDKDKFTLSPEISIVLEEQINARFCHNDMDSPFIKELISETKDFLVEKLEEN